jgi:HlyD family secretion protein
MPILYSLLRWPKAAVRSGWRIGRKYPKRSLAIIVVLGLLYLLIWALRQPAPPEYVTEVAVRGDLVQVVEAVGEVISERDLNLQFPITGVIDRVFVQEGDHVEQGKELARLRSSGLSADVASAQAQVASAAADLRKLEEGTRPEEIAVNEASVANKRAALSAAEETLENAERQLEVSGAELESLRAEAEVSLQGDVDNARSTVSQQLSVALTAALRMDDVLADNYLLDAFVKYEPGKYELLRSQISSAQISIKADTNSSVMIDDPQSAVQVLTASRQHLSDLAAVLNDAYTVVSSLEVTPYFTAAKREDAKSAIATERSNVQTALSTLDSTLSSLRDASATYDTRIAAEESSLISAEGTRDRALADIRTYETSLRIEEAQLELMKAGSRPADIDAARGRLAQAYAGLQRSRERYADTVIVAPLAGTITKVNLKEGELLSTSFASDAAIAMLGDAPYRIQMFVAEVDVPKIQLTQSGAIELDAFPGELMDLIVTDNDPAATVVDGVAKYRVKLDFVAQAEGIKIGMTGDAEVYTDRRDDVVIVPGRAVFTGDDGKDHVRIQLENGVIEERTVVVGIDGRGGEVEVISGIAEGESVVVLIKE